MDREDKKASVISELASEQNLTIRAIYEKLEKLKSIRQRFEGSEMDVREEPAKIDPNCSTLEQLKKNTSNLDSLNNYLAEELTCLEQIIG